MGMVIEVGLCKSVVSSTANSYVLRPLSDVAIDIPIPVEINRMLDQGYFIKEVRLKEAPLNNFGPGGIFNGQTSNF